ERHVGERTADVEAEPDVLGGRHTRKPALQHNATSFAAAIKARRVGKGGHTVRVMQWLSPPCPRVESSRSRGHGGTTTMPKRECLGRLCPPYERYDAGASIRRMPRRAGKRDRVAHVGQPGDVGER